LKSGQASKNQGLLTFSVFGKTLRCGVIRAKEEVNLKRYFEVFTKKKIQAPEEDIVSEEEKEGGKKFDIQL